MIHALTPKADPTTGLLAPFVRFPKIRQGREKHWTQAEDRTPRPLTANLVLEVHNEQRSRKVEVDADQKYPASKSRGDPRDGKREAVFPKSSKEKRS